MDVKSSAHYQREYRRRLRDQGLVKKEVWIRPEHAKHLASLEKQLRVADSILDAEGGKLMKQTLPAWTTLSLYQALMNADEVVSGSIRLELIDGSEPVLHVEMVEFGDLPMFLTVSGEQILVESLLWPVSSVREPRVFNEVVLKTHKYFPLSTISLEPTVQGGNAYFMFGALSDGAPLSDVLVEIETLASNVLQATEAYEGYLISENSEAME